MRAVSAVVPAAGLSSRFGGPNKLLQPYKDTTVIGAVVRALLACDLDVFVVTGRDAKEVAKASSPAKAVFNPDYRSGLGTSIARGVRATPPGAILIALGDMPGLNPKVVKSLLDAQIDDRTIVAPVYYQEPARRGHPVLFGSAHRAALEALSKDEGANSVVLANTLHLELVAVGHGLADIDTPTDL